MNSLKYLDGLALEKKWITQDSNFRIATGLVGMTVVDVLNWHSFMALFLKVFMINLILLFYIMCSLNHFLFQLLSFKKTSR